MWGFLSAFRRSVGNKCTRIMLGLWENWSRRRHWKLHHLALQVVQLQLYWALRPQHIDEAREAKHIRPTDSLDRHTWLLFKLRNSHNSWIQLLVCRTLGIVHTLSSSLCWIRVTSTARPLKVSISMCAFKSTSFDTGSSAFVPGRKSCWTCS